MKKTLAFLLGAGLLVAVGASQAKAIEMFTNFNDGMELGYRPLGVPDFAPVRFHSHQPQRWYDRHGMERPCNDFQYGPAPSPPTVVPPSNVPGTQWGDGAMNERRRPADRVASNRADREDLDWVRGQSFLPNSSAN